MPTDTFPIAAATDDGCGLWTSGSWPPSFSADESDTELICSKALVGNYVEEISFMRWDTSTLPDDSTIDSANLQLYATSRNDTSDNYSLVGDYYDFGGEPVVAGDFIETASPTIFTAKDIGTFTLSAVNTIALTDLTGISKTGTTGIRLTLSSGTPAAENYIIFAAFEHAQQEPRLEVTWTAAPAGTGLAWIRA